VFLRGYGGRGGRWRNGGEDDPGGQLGDRIWGGGGALPAAVGRDRGVLRGHAEAAGRSSCVLHRWATTAEMSCGDGRWGWLGCVCGGFRRQLRCARSGESLSRAVCEFRARHKIYGAS
jgi:hypothetical protein